MPRSVRNRPARHGAGPGLVTIACLAGAALAVDRAVRHAPAALRGARDVLAAATISAVILTAVAVLVIITWAALRAGRRARQPSDQTSGLPGPRLTGLEPEPAVVPVPERLPGRPLFIHGTVSRVAAARAAVDQEAAAHRLSSPLRPGRAGRTDGSAR